MQRRCSWLILLGQEHRAVVEQVRIRVVSVDQEDFGNVSASRPALDMYHHVQGVGDVRLNRAIRQFDPALQDAAREPREPLLRRVRMDRGQRPGVPGVWELQKIKGFAAANLPENDSVRAMAES